MQQGNIVFLGSGCDATQSGQHQVEDYCRQCGSPAGVAELVAALRRLLEAAKAKEFDQWYDGVVYCSECEVPPQDDRSHDPDCPYAAAIAEAERLLNESEGE